MAVAIKTGILYVPTLDADTGRALLATLRAARAHPVLVIESSAQSQRNWVTDVLCRWCDEDELDLVLTAGGTLPAPGPGAQEIVPEATAEILERELPGLAEAMRAYAAEEDDLALLERGRAGIRGRTLILNLPAGAGAASLFLEAVAHLVVPVLAHLREETDAPTLATVLDEEGQAADVESRESAGVADGESPAASAANETASPSSPQARGLSESEFAAFLRRSANKNAGDE